MNLQITNIQAEKNTVELNSIQSIKIKGGGEEDAFYNQYFQLLSNPNVQISLNDGEDLLRIQIVYVAPGNAINNEIANR